MASTHFATDGKMGVDLEDVVTSANEAVLNGSGRVHALNTQVAGNNNSDWLYVYASAAITQYAVVGVEASGTASMLTSTIARGATPVNIGIAQVAFAAGDRGWVATGGTSLTVLTTAVCTAGAKLFTTATAGRVSTTQATATDAQISGLVHSVTTGATASSSPCIAKNLSFQYPTLLST